MSSYYLLAKIGVDTAENEPEVEVWSLNYTCVSYVEPSYGVYLAMQETRSTVLNPRGKRTHL